MKFKLSQELRLLVIGAAVFFTIILALTLHRHFTFYSSYDQGIFNQVFWNGIHGRFFQSSLSSQLSTNVVHSGELPRVDYHRLGQHFTPALLIWHPLYALFPYPATLTVIQATLMTGAGLVLYALAREYLKPGLALLITFSFYCGNAVVGPILANFHDICQIPILVFSLLLAVEKRWWWLFSLTAILIPLVREDSGITLFSIGFYFLVTKRFPRIGLGLCLFGLTYMLVLTNLVMPLFSEDISKRFMLERFGQYVEGEEASTLDIIFAMVSQPHKVLAELVSPLGGTIKYLLGHWLPLAFVPVLSPASWLVAGFPLLKLLLGKGVSVLSINIRYALTVVPGMYYGVILWWAGQGWQRWRKDPRTLAPRNLSNKFRRFWLFCLGLSLMFTLTSNPNRTLYFLIPDAIRPWVHVPLVEQWRHSSQIYALLSLIPKDASVSATTYLIPHLSGRREIIRLPDLELINDQGEVIEVQYAVADLKQLRIYGAALSEEAEVLEDVTNLIDDVTEDKEYGIVAVKDGVILLQQGVKSNDEAAAQWLDFRTLMSN